MATTSDVPLPRRSLKPWATILSSSLLKVQVILRSATEHSPTFVLTPSWLSIIGSVSLSLLRTCSGSAISKESPPLAWALLASQLNFSLR